MLQSKVSNATKTYFKAMPDLSQVKSQLKADSPNIFLRILSALNVANASQAAQKLGITKQSVYEWKENVPSVESLALIAKSGDASLHWILTGEGEREIYPDKQISFGEIFENKIREIVQDELTKGNAEAQKPQNKLNENVTQVAALEAKKNERYQQQIKEREESKGKKTGS